MLSTIFAEVKSEAVVGTVQELRQICKDKYVCNLAHIFLEDRPQPDVS